MNAPRKRIRFDVLIGRAIRPRNRQLTFCNLDIEIACGTLPHLATSVIPSILFQGCQFFENPARRDADPIEGLHFAGIEFHDCEFHTDVTFSSGSFQLKVLFRRCTSHGLISFNEASFPHVTGLFCEFIDSTVRYLEFLPGALGRPNSMHMTPYVAAFRGCELLGQVDLYFPVGDCQVDFERCQFSETSYVNLVVSPSVGVSPKLNFMRCNLAGMIDAEIEKPDEELSAAGNANDLGSKLELKIRDSILRGFINCDAAQLAALDLSRTQIHGGEL